jgi:tetratricopeptide (TPR) repeat protein
MGAGFSRGWGQGRRGAIALSLMLGMAPVVGVLHAPAALAQGALLAEDRDAFLADHLTADPRDPLLPQIPVQRDLSPLERRELNFRLDALSLEAAALREAGENDDAFELWMRELQLRRLFGFEAEMEAIERVGAIAWEENRTQEVQLISLRLAQLRDQRLAPDPEADAPEDPDAEASESPLVSEPTPLRRQRLERIADAFILVRDWRPGVAIYQDLADRAASRGDRSEYQRLLGQVGEQQIAWFDFPAAARTHQQLLLLARPADPLFNLDLDALVESTDPASLPDLEPLVPELLSALPGELSQADLEPVNQLLRRLIYAYEQDQRYALAIASQAELLIRYRLQGNFRAIPPLSLGIARNFQAESRPNVALRFYQVAYREALALQQLGYASDVLLALGALYRDLGLAPDALTIYDLLLRVERQAIDGYGVMTAYDEIGKIHQQRGETAAAVSAFREGLLLAIQLDHRQAYFRQRLDELTRPPSLDDEEATDDSELEPPTEALEPDDLFESEPFDQDPDATSDPGQREVLEIMP